MLNDYQKQFLRLLAASNARFLVIGGVARIVHAGGSTRDLDVLVDISARNLAATEFALSQWSSTHPVHSPNVPAFPPIGLKAGLHINFPEHEQCYYRNDLDEECSIDPDNGVDVLTSLPAFNFEALYARSVPWNFEGYKIQLLSADDLERTKK